MAGRRPTKRANLAADGVRQKPTTHRKEDGHSRHTRRWSGMANSPAHWRLFSSAVSRKKY